MKMIDCSGDDGFVAKGNTEDEALDRMMDHLKQSHPEKMKGDQGKTREEYRKMIKDM